MAGNCLGFRHYLWIICSISVFGLTCFIRVGRNWQLFSHSSEFLFQINADAVCEYKPITHTHFWLDQGRYWALKWNLDEEVCLCNQSPISECSGEFILRFWQITVYILILRDSKTSVLNCLFFLSVYFYNRNFRTESAGKKGFIHFGCSIGFWDSKILSGPLWMEIPLTTLSSVCKA